MENPFEECDTGCSFCGMYFHTRTGLSKHQKTEHNIHNAQGVAPVANSQQISGMTPLWSGITSLRSGMTPLRSRMTPLWSGMSPIWSGQVIPLTLPESLHKIPQKNLRCKCNEQCQNVTELNLHILMNKGINIECNSCQKKFFFKCVFRQHQKLHCSQIIPPPSSQDPNQIEVFHLVSDVEQDVQNDSLVLTDIDMSSLTHTSNGSLLPSNAKSPPQTLYGRTNGKQSEAISSANSSNLNTSGVKVNSILNLDPNKYKI